MLLVQLALASVAACSTVQLARRAVVVDDVSTLSAQYDYIIIGGGTSGLTVADRLTEDPESMSLSIALRILELTVFSLCTATVLVIEAGPLYDERP